MCVCVCVLCTVVLHGALQNVLYIPHDNSALFLNSTSRLCKEDCIVNGIPITKGVTVVIPMYSFHRKPEIWPNPEKFDPERYQTRIHYAKSVCIILCIKFHSSLILYILHSSPSYVL